MTRYHRAYAAIAEAQQTGQCWFDAELLSRRGELLLLCGRPEPSGAEAAFLTAIAIACPAEVATRPSLQGSCRRRRCVFAAAVHIVPSACLWLRGKIVTYGRAPTEPFTDFLGFP